MIKQRVKLTVTGDCGHVLWTGFDVIEEKYPFWCAECEDTPHGRYPWKLASEIVAEPAPETVPWPTGLCGHTVAPAAWSQGIHVCRECLPGQAPDGAAAL